MMRARDLGAVTGCRPGERNAITDVPGVRVGHTTVVEPPDIHTGVTAVVPAGSCMLVAATDAPLDARQLTRVARRQVYGMGRVERPTATAAATTLPHEKLRTLKHS